MGRDAVVDVYADFQGGRSQYAVGNLGDLKHQICDRLSRNDIVWDSYQCLVNNRGAEDDRDFMDGDVVKFIQIEKPQEVNFAPLMEAMKEFLQSERVRVKKACPTCNAPLPKADTLQKEEDCVYCGCVIEVI